MELVMFAAASLRLVANIIYPSSPIKTHIIYFQYGIVALKVSCAAVLPFRGLGNKATLHRIVVYIIPFLFYHVWAP